MFVPFLTHVKERDCPVSSVIYYSTLWCLENHHEGCTRTYAGEAASFVKKEVAAMLKVTY